MLVIGLESVSLSNYWFDTKSYQQYPMILERHLVPKTSIHLQVGVQCPCLNHRVRQGSPATWRSKSSSVCTGTDNAKIQVHNTVNQANQPYDFLAWPTVLTHYTTEVCEVFWDLNALTTCMNKLYCLIQTPVSLQTPGPWSWAWKP